MPNILADRVLESSVSAGTGVFTLAGAVLGFRAFSTVCAVTDTMPYYIEAVDAQGRPTAEWEYGLGTYSAANQLTRTTVRGSSNAGLTVGFAAGTKLVGLGIAAPNSTATRLEWRDALSVYSKAEVYTQAQVDAAVSGAVLPGAVVSFARVTPPTGWIKANGAAVNRVTYAALFSAIGTTFGAGDGSTTFNVPDLRGEFIRGWDDGRGADPGRVFGSFQGHLFESHAHTATAAVNIGGTFTSAGATGAGGSSITTNPTGGSETRPRNVALLTCIKF